MREKAPTMDEIREVKHLHADSSFQDLTAMEFFKDQRKMTIVKNMTELLMRNAAEESRESVWKFCKKLAGYSFAPAAPAEMKRMRPYTQQPEIVDAVLAGLQENSYPFKVGELSQLEPIQGYYYCIALVSQCACRREECLACLERVSDYFLKNLPDKVWLLERNMKVLKGEFPDLEPLYRKLAGQ